VADLVTVGTGWLIPKAGTASAPDSAGIIILAAIIGALIGGILTFAGSFVSSWWLGRTERGARREQERLDLIGAITIVEYELVENVAWLQSKLLHPGGARPVPLSNVAYRSVQLLLARRLPAQLSTQVARTYAMVPVAEADVQHGIETGGLSADEIQGLEGIVTDMQKTNQALTAHEATLRR
jgi:hypothetical protein